MRLIIGQIFPFVQSFFISFFENFYKIYLSFSNLSDFTTTFIEAFTDAFTDISLMLLLIFLRIFLPMFVSGDVFIVVSTNIFHGCFIVVCCIKMRIYTFFLNILLDQSPQQ